MQFYPFTVSAAASEVLNVQGDFVYFSSISVGAPYPTVKIGTDRGEVMILKPGQGARLPQPVKRLTITNYDAQNTITGVLLVTNGEFRDNRIQGEVSVIEGGRQRGLAGSAFVGSVSVGAVVANYSLVQLWNPAASGKNLVVSKIIASQSGAAAGATMALRRDSVALTTLSGTPPQPKMLGGTSASVAQMRSQNAAAIPGAGLSAWYQNTETFHAIPLTEPYVIKEGFGLVLVGGVNWAINGDFDFWEDSAS